MVTRDDFVARLKAAYLDPLHVLQVPGALMFRSEVNLIGRDVTYLKETDSWLATVTLPLSETAMGAEATLSARIDLRRLRNHVEEHRFNQTGSITIVDRFARRIFDPEQPDLRHYQIVGEAMGLLASGARVVRTARSVGPDGRVLLGAYAFPRPVKWAVLVEKDEADAYLFITQMRRSLLLWGLVGLGLAVAGAILLAVRISRPILEIARVTAEVAKGNFQARVGRGAELKDEIGDLARRVNDMTTGLNERVHLQKFVSGGTIDAIRLAKGAGISLGGARVRVTTLFSGIRGYTAFAECHPPDVVVQVLNYFFQHLTEIVVQNEGDIDKFVGDQIFAVFQGGGMERNAVRCALDMQRKMGELSRERSEWDLTIGIGINTGEVIMGAMGSRQRMDYTVLGDPVNLAARLCSNSGCGQILIGQETYTGIAGSPEFKVTALAPMRIKGKKDTVLVYQVLPPETTGRRAGDTPQPPVAKTL
jgi:adenylate cyclase